LPYPPRGTGWKWGKNYGRILPSLEFVAVTRKIKLELPDDLSRFRLPKGVDARLTELLDRQDAGETLSRAERAEAEGLVDLAEMLSLLKLRSTRLRR
jgi:hypothetical protein